MSKATQITITCDGCGADISPIDSSYPHQYILTLRSEDIGINTSNLVYGVAMYPPLSSALHFCREDCVREWANGRHDAEVARKAAQDAEVAEKGYYTSGDGTHVYKVGPGHWHIPAKQEKA